MILNVFKKVINLIAISLIFLIIYMVFNFFRSPRIIITNESSERLEQVFLPGVTPDSIGALNPKETKTVILQSVGTDDIALNFVVKGKKYYSSAGGYIQMRGGFYYHYIISEDLRTYIKKWGYLGF